MVKAILMNSEDNVATLLADVNAGGMVEVTSTTGEVTRAVESKQSIPSGHKISIADLRTGEKILKYGEVIGEATLPIARGEHVHIHNVKSMTWGKFR